MWARRGRDVTPSQREEEELIAIFCKETHLQVGLTGNTSNHLLDWCDPRSPKRNGHYVHSIPATISPFYLYEAYLCEYAQNDIGILQCVGGSRDLRESLVLLIGCIWLFGWTVRSR